MQKIWLHMGGSGAVAAAEHLVGNTATTIYHERGVYHAILLLTHRIGCLQNTRRPKSPRRMRQTAATTSLGNDYIARPLRSTPDDEMFHSWSLFISPLFACACCFICFYLCSNFNPETLFYSGDELPMCTSRTSSRMWADIQQLFRSDTSLLLSGPPWFWDSTAGHISDMPQRTFPCLR